MTELKGIGGYFELELPREKKNGGGKYLFNSGRSALAFLLQNQAIKKVLVPNFTCEVVLDPIKKLNIEYEFYSINAHLLPELEINRLDESTAVLINSYYGLLEDEISKLPFIDHAIIDNSQSFYSTLIGGFGAFNSFRKFFGLADGAEAFFNKKVKTLKFHDLPRYQAIDKMIHLLGRIEVSPEDYFKYFCENEKSLKFNGVQRISKLSERIYSSIDHEFVKEKRIENFNYIHKSIGYLNEFFFHQNIESVPFVYPLLLSDGNKLRDYLISQRIYIAKYWSFSNSEFNPSELENKFIKNLVAIPIDQRYGKMEMEFIVNKIKLYG